MIAVAYEEGGNVECDLAGELRAEAATEVVVDANDDAELYVGNSSAVYYLKAKIMMSWVEKTFPRGWVES